MFVSDGLGVSKSNVGKVHTRNKMGNGPEEGLDPS